MNHFILTRFSGPRLDVWPDADWCRHRLEVLKALYMPGRRSQTVEPTAWIASVGEQTPPEVMAELESLGFYLAVWRFDETSVSRVFRQVTQHFDGPCISTRFDSDDRLAPDAVERIQKWAEDAPLGSVMNFARGYNVSAEGATQGRWEAGAFQSYLSDGPLVYGLGSHSKLHLTHTVDLDEKPAWARYCHGANASKTANLNWHVFEPGVPFELPAWAQWPEGFAE